MGGGGGGEWGGGPYCQCFRMRMSKRGSISVLIEPAKKHQSQVKNTGLIRQNGFFLNILGDTGLTLDCHFFLTSKHILKEKNSFFKKGCFNAKIGSKQS